MSVINFAPQMQSPSFSSLTYPTTVVGLPVVTTATTPVTGTVAQFLGGLLAVDCQDAGTLTTPTAALFNAAIPAIHVGSSFEVDIINYGDSTLTIGLGTGVTKVTIATVAAVMTIVTLASKRLRFVCTGVASDAVVGSADAWVVYGFGSTAAAVA